MPLRSTLVLFAAASLLIAGCSSDPDGNDTGNDDVGVDIGRDTGTDTDDTGEVTDTGDDTADTADDSDSLPDGLFCDDDDDHDGHYAVACGGDDCDDSNPRAYIGAPEVCDDTDNNCDGTVNEGITCTFYAHTGEALYAVNPLTNPPTAERVADTPGDTALWDIDTHPDGTLYGVSADALYRYNAESATFETVNALSGYEGDANGMAIDNAGVAFITSGDSLYTIDLDTAVMSEVGSGAYESSGDCVVDKGGQLYLSSRLEDYEDNTLVLLDGTTGAGTVLGHTGFSGIYALTSAWGILYGMTSNGELIEIDATTGAAELVHAFGESYRWYGAASSPER